MNTTPSTTQRLRRQLAHLNKMVRQAKNEDARHTLTLIRDDAAKALRNYLAFDAAE